MARDMTMAVEDTARDMTMAVEDTARDMTMEDTARDTAMEGTARDMVTTRIQVGLFLNNNCSTPARFVFPIDFYYTCILCHLYSLKVCVSTSHYTLHLY